MSIKSFCPFLYYLSCNESERRITQQTIPNLPKKGLRKVREGKRVSETKCQEKYKRISVITTDKTLPEYEMRMGCCVAHTLVHEHNETRHEKYDQKRRRISSCGLPLNLPE